MIRSYSLILFVLLTVTGGQSALATSLTTIFGPNTTPGAPPDPSVLRGLESFTTFTGGETLFFQNGNFYVGGAGPATDNPLSAQGLENFGGVPQVNNRAFGVAGPGTANINFSPGIVDEITLQVRGTEDRLLVGPTAPGTTFPNSTPLDNAAGTLEVFTNLGLQTTIPIANADYAPLTLQLGGMINGNSFRQLILSNNGSSNSAILLGELTVEAVPEPSTVLLLGSGLIGLGLWRLRGHHLS